MEAVSQLCLKNKTIHITNMSIFYVIKGGIGLDEIKVLFKSLYPSLPDEDPIYTQALQALDLEDNGSISFDEFKKILLPR